MGKRRLLHNRDFLLLWSSQVLSDLGNWMNLMAFVVFAYRATGTATSSSLMMALRLFPAFAIGPIAGAIVDRHDRRRVMILADVLRACAFLLLPFSYHLWHVYLGAFLTAVMGVWFRPAKNALLPEIVSREHLVRANSLTQATQNLSLLAGSSLGGLLLVYLSPQWLFVINAVTFLVSAVALVWVRPRRQSDLRNDALGAAHSAAVRSIWAEVGAGLAHLWHSASLRSVVATYCVSATGVGALNSILVAITQQMLRASETDVGYVVSAQAAGAICGAAILGTYAGTRTLARWFAVAMIGSGLFTTAFSQATSLTTGLLLYLSVGLFDGMVEAACPTLLQLHAIPGFRTRIFATLQALVNGCQLSGMIAAGVLMDNCGGSVTVMWAGLVILVAGVAFHLRQAGHPASTRRAGWPA